MSEKEPIIFDLRNSDSLMQAYISVDDSRIRFNKAAKEMCGVRMGSKVHIIYFGNYEEEKWTENLWYFYVDDDKNGIHVSIEGSGTLLAHNKPISRMLFTHAKAAMASSRSELTSISLVVQRSKKEWKGKKLWKINLFETYKSPMRRKGSKKS